MSRALLDVNALIAMIDPNHVFHSHIHEWWMQNKNFGWASCPIIENAVIRIISAPSYSSQTLLSLQKVAQVLKEFTSKTDHEFWTDSISLNDKELFNLHFLTGHRQITDTYLLALAVKNEGRLVTFDHSINIASVHGAKSNHVLKLSIKA